MENKKLSILKDVMHIAAKKFAKETIADPSNHPEAVVEFEENFIKGAEWLIVNIEFLKSKGLTDFVDSIDEAVEKHATLLFNKCETSHFSEEEKDNLFDSFKYPYEEGINWAYDNYEE